LVIGFEKYPCVFQLPSSAQPDIVFYSPTPKAASQNGAGRKARLTRALTSIHPGPYLSNMSFFREG
jgi:hypothetical protein